MNCDRHLELIGPYVDGELDLRGVLDLERHLENCGTCQQAHRQLRKLKGSIVAAAPYYKAPVDLVAQVRARISIAPPVESAGGMDDRGESRKDPHPGPLPEYRAREKGGSPHAIGRIFPRWLAAAAAILLVASVSAVVLLRDHVSTDALSRELVAAHVRSTQVDHLVDVLSSDQHTVKPWFSGKLDFSLPVADFASVGFKLEGGRLDYIAGRAVAVLVYRHDRHVINCFVWPGDREESGVSSSTSQGFSIVRFEHKQLNWCLVSDASAQTIERLAKLIGE